jgi:hypothetical protein
MAGIMTPLRQAFEDFHQANPHIWDLFVQFSHDIRANHSHFSADAVLHRIRWEVATTTTEYEAGSHKINNNYSAFYARKLMDADPSFAGFFSTRTSVADEPFEAQQADNLPG